MGLKENILSLICNEQVLRVSVLLALIGKIWNMENDSLIRSELMNELIQKRQEGGMLPSNKAT